MNDTLIFLVLAGIALVFKFLNRERPEEPPSTGRAPNEPPARNPAPRVLAPRAPAESEEEKVRRFLEALGAPPGSRPPPPVAPRTPAPRRVLTPTATEKPRSRPKPKRSWVQPLPPVVTTPPPEVELPPLVTAPEPVVVEVAPLLPTLLEPARAVVRPRPAATRPTEAGDTRGLSIGEMLRARGSARQAMVLREVLGPPRGLQPIEFAGTRPL